MPITKSAKKAMRQSLRKRAVNSRRSKVMKEEVKKIIKLAKTDKKEAQKILATTYQAIDKAAKRGIIKKNTAARKKSRLTKLINK